MIHIHQIKAMLKIKPQYTCSHCGKKELGDWLSADITFEDSGEVKSYLDNIQPSSRYMPVGWSFDGKYSCGCHKGKSDAKT